MEFDEARCEEPGLDLYDHNEIPRVLSPARAMGEHRGMGNSLAIETRIEAERVGSGANN